MPWVSNYTAKPITVSITSKTAGSDHTFTIQPFIPYSGDKATPETAAKNFWWRKGTEELAATVDGKDVAFPVEPNDHVNFYSDAYEIFTSQIKRIS